MSEESRPVNEVFAALSKAQKEIRGAVKDAANPHFKSRYADLESTWEAVRDPLVANGLCITQLVEEKNGKAYLITTLGHVSGQSISSSIPLICGKQDMQGLGSAITYARRYGLQAILSCPSVDDDGEEAVKSSQKENRPSTYPHPSSPGSKPNGEAARPVSAEPKIAPEVIDAWKVIEALRVELEIPKEDLKSVLLQEFKITQPKDLTIAQLKRVIVLLEAEKKSRAKEIEVSPEFNAELANLGPIGAGR